MPSPAVLGEMLTGDELRRWDEYLSEQETAPSADPLADDVHGMLTTRAMRRGLGR